jgi:hypothetical protein
MATPTKNEIEIVSSKSVPVSPGVQQGTQVLNGFGATGVARITNSGSAPTAPCHFKLYYKMNGDSWLVSEQSAGVAASEVFTFPFRVPKEVQEIAVVFEDNTVNTVTVACYINEVTAIG